MKSKNLKELTLVHKDKKKKILFINPKRNDAKFTFPHNGLAMLGTILKKRGHEVNIVDYAFLFEDNYTDVSYFLNKFNPDIVGISVYTPNVSEFEEILDRVYKYNPKIPIMVGGPHATLYHELLKEDKRIDYIVRGEAELTIIPVVENSKKEKSPRIIETKEIVALSDLPLTDYKVFYKWNLMTHYPIMTSRGCPNKCSFCASSVISRKWRFREPEECIEELKIAKKDISTHLKFVVFDDNPTVIKERFHKFLELYNDKIKSELVIVNTRADGIDEKFLNLIKEIGTQQISIGVEHVHPEVVKLINKGETVERIEEACKLIKKHKMKLCLSFVIGLPNDNLERTKANIKFFKKVKADSTSINQLTPFRFTKAREILEKNNAKLYNEIDYASSSIKNVECEKPIVETEDFTIHDREKAFYMFLFGIADTRLKLRYLPEIFLIAKKYGLYGEFFIWIPKGILTSLKDKKRYFLNAFIIYRTDGLLHLFKRFNALMKQEKILRKNLKK